MIKALISDIQILSAIVWAVTIIASSYITGNSDVAMMLTTAAGFHVLLLMTWVSQNKKSKIQN